MRRAFARLVPMMILLAATVATAQSSLPGLAATSESVQQALVARTARPSAAASPPGLAQVADYWRAEDGDAADFAAFVATYFAPAGPQLDALFARLETNLESLDGHLLEIGRDWRSQSELDLGPAYPFDELMAGYAPGGALPGRQLPEQAGLRRAPQLPADHARGAPERGRDLDAPAVGRGAAGGPLRQAHPRRGEPGLSRRRSAEAEPYIAGYNIWMHHLLDAKGQRPFAAGKRLLSHWNLRDELKAHYARGAAGPRRAAHHARVMERIVDQTIPAVRHRQPVRGLESLHQRGEARRREGQRPARRRRTCRSRTRPSPTPATQVLLKCFQAVKRQPIPTARARPRTSPAASRRAARSPRPA